MKKLETLVDDIYGTLSNGLELTDEQATEFGKEMASLIKTRLKPRREREPALRLSGIGKADYQLWYEMNGHKPDEKFPANVLLKFLYGDIIETILLNLAKWSGHTVVEEQDEVYVNGVKGHKDARIDLSLIHI